MTYKHGIYTESVAATGNVQTTMQGTIPVYIGTAPTADDKIATPVLISSYDDFKTKMGESDDWDNFTLCEVAYAHFRNSVQSVGPIIVINIYDSTKHKDDDGNVDLSLITEDEFEAGLDAIDLALIKCGVVPNIILAPVFDKTYADKIISKCEALISGKWGCVAYIDIPTDTANTIDTAISYKTTAAIKSKSARLHFPKAKYGNKVFHLSVLDAVTSQIVDRDSDGIPCHSSSNKRIMCDVPVLSASAEFIYSENDANKLNAAGITTINYIGGAFRVWGGHMANYDYTTIDNIDAKDRSDATVRMQIFLHNWLKSEHIDNIDGPITRRDIDNIVSNVNIGLNSFVNGGYLLKGECYFSDSNNSENELADGNLVLDVLHTEVPNGKSISFRLQYDLSGLNTLYESAEV